MSATSFRGTVGNDTFFFKTATDLSQAALVDGGADWDELQLTSGGITDDAFARVTGIEAVRLWDTGAVTVRLGALASAAFSGALSIVAESATSVNIDASALTAGKALYLRASAGADSIIGSAAADNIVGNGGADVIKTGAGADVIIFSTAAQLAQAALVDGGADWDELQVTSGGITDAAFARVTSIEAVRSMDFGALTVRLGALASSAFSGALSIVAERAASVDIDASALTAGKALYLRASIGADSIIGSAGADNIVGNGGADVIKTGAGDDVVVFATAAQLAQAAQMDGGAGWDELQVTSGGITDAAFARVTGIEAVRLFGTGVINVQLGSLAANAFAQAVSIVAERAGSVVIDASILQSTTPLYLRANIGADSIIGSAGADNIVGNGGADVIKTGAGNDVVVFAIASQMSQAALVDGGAGWDELQVTTGAITDAAFAHVTGIEAVRLLGTTALNVQLGAAASHAFTGAASIVAELARSVTVDASNLSSMPLYLHASAGADNIVGSASADNIVGNGGADVIKTGAGDDVVVFATAAQLAQATLVDGGAGWDEVQITSGGVTAAAFGRVTGIEAVRLLDTGAVTIQLGATIGSAFTDGHVKIIASNTAALNLDASLLGAGMAGNIVGSSGADTILGSNGADTIDGGAGNDLLRGNAGADLFVFGPKGGHDTIQDFASGIDHLLLRGAGLDAQHVGMPMMHGTDVGVDIMLPDGSVISLVGIQASSLLADDFLFA